MKHTRRATLNLVISALAGLSIGRRSTAASTSAAGPRKAMRILILGGTGFIGPYQVRYALARGHKITIFNRGSTTQAWPGEVEELTGDRNLGDLKSLEGRKWDVCIDNPTTLPRWVRDAGRVLRGKVNQYIFISTVSAYAANDKAEDESALVAGYTGKDAMAETQESLRASGGALYGPLKALSERQAKEYFPGATTIIRPGLIAGPGDQSDRFTYWPVRLLRGGEILAPGDGSDPVQFIDVRDLSEWVIRLAESRVIGTFNATGPENPLNMREMLRTISLGLHSKAQLTWVSADFLDSEHVSPWTDMPVWVPGSGDTAGFARRNVGKARAAGLVYRNLATTALDTLDWYNQLPADRRTMLKAGLSEEREAQLLELWKNRTKSGA
jgi:nucleoside-diphosphate-sugar epimerase